MACLGGTKYQTAFKQQVVALFERYDIAYGYFDGYLAECSEPDHGHEPGALSAETIAEGFLEVIQAIRAVNPDAWLEATCLVRSARLTFCLRGQSLLLLPNSQQKKTCPTKDAL